MKSPGCILNPDQLWLARPSASKRILFGCSGPVKHSTPWTECSGETRARLAELILNLGITCMLCSVHKPK